MCFMIIDFKKPNNIFYYEIKQRKINFTIPAQVIKGKCYESQLML